ncbi:MAG: tetratricopeptide repeat protein [Phycisphaerales bacterium]|nr:MAG: tetratricopeptide repeat protein [Phycisphaerales bacterium]
MAGRRLQRFDLSAILVVGVCLAAQLAYLTEGTKDPTFEIPIIDAGVYHNAAIRFAEGGSLHDDAFWQPPLFPLFLGCVYRLVGTNILIAKLILAGIATLTSLLVWWIGRRVFSRRVGAVAGLIVAVYGPFVFFSTQLLPTGLAVFLDLAALVLWLRCMEQPCRHRWLLFGLAVGAATITVPNAGVLAIIALVGVVVSGVRQRSLRAALVACSMIVLGTALPVGSVTLRNYVVSGELIIISTNGGMNFYVGNNPQSDKTVAIRPGEPWRRLARESYSGGARTRAEQSTYFFRRGFAYLGDQPLSFLRGLVRKGIRLANAREIPRNVDVYVYRDFSHVLSILMWRVGPLAFPFGLLAPLAAVGVVVSLKSSAKTGVQRTGPVALLSFIVAYGASVVAFFVSARYRLPIAVVMSLFAAAGAVWIWDRVRAFKRRRTKPRLAFAVAALACAAIVVNWPVRAPADGVNFRAELSMCLGHAYGLRGEPGMAEQRFRRALRLDPEYSAAGAKLAGLLLESGRVDEAEKLLRDARTWGGQSVEAHHRLGELLHSRGQIPEAISVFEEALTIDPTSPEVQGALADAFADSDRIDEAIDHYRKAIDLADEPGPLVIRLGDALVQRGDYEKAIERYRQGLWLTEPEPAALNRIAWLLATCPVIELRDCERAIEIAEHVCWLTDYRNPVSMDTLAAAYAECGRWAEAVTWVRRAVDTALADNDRAAADSFRPRLKTYQEHLSGQVQSRRKSPPPPPSEGP